MTEPENHKPFIGSIDAVIPGMQRFSHEAMATTFEVIIIHTDTRYARQAAEAAFDEVDRLEGQFSRFIENSDISQIGNLAVNQTLVLGLDSFRCLQISSHMCKETGGAFDVTIGCLMNCWRADDKTFRRPGDEELKAALRQTGCGIFKLDEEQHTIKVSVDNPRIDLGGIGKGFAVDRMAELLRDWDIETALISGGGSSVLALEGPSGLKGWPVTLSNPDSGQVLVRPYLKNKSLSGSGLQKSRHIIDPRTGQPVEGKLAAWSSASDAAMADALSTAFMVMKPDEIEQYCQEHPGVLAMIVLSNAEKQKVLQYGRWQDLFIDSNANSS